MIIEVSGPERLHGTHVPLVNQASYSLEFDVSENALSVRVVLHHEYTNE